MSKIAFKKIFFVGIFLFISQAIAYQTKQVSLTNQEKQYLKAKKEITMCVDPDWYPFEAIDKNGNHIGIASDLIKIVAKRTGIQIKLIKTNNWYETLNLSKTKQCDIVSFLNQSPMRDDWLIFSEPLLVDRNVLIAREEFPFVSDINGLSNKTIAIPAETSIAEKVKKDFPNLKIINAKDESESCKMVSERKADVTLRSLIMASYTIRKDGLFNLKIAGQPDGYENIFRIGILKDDVILKEILNKGIRTITPIEKESIVAKYTGIKYQDGIDYKTFFIWFSIGTLLMILVLVWNYTLRKKVSIEADKNNKMKEQLYIKSKQIELGNLMGNIAHQWLGPLSKLSTINLLLITKLNSDKQVSNEYLYEKSSEIEKTIDFMSQTVKRFLEFYKENRSKNDVQMKRSIEDAIFIVQARIIDLSLKIEINGDVLLKNAIQNEWVQIWLNLINNSIEAFERNKISNPEIIINIKENSVSFCDNAGGMDMKKTYEGLGHKICKDIVKKYHAKLRFKNSESGLCAIISLNHQEIKI